MNPNVRTHTAEEGSHGPLTRRKAEAFFALGLRAARRGDMHDAADHFRRAVETDSAFTDAHFHLARASRELGELDQAVYSLTSVVNLRPDDSDAWYTLGNTYGAMQDHGRAEECYRTACRLDPDDVRAYNNCGVALHALGRTADARDCYRAALAIDPDHADAHYNMSLAYLLDGMFEQGWKEFEWRFLASEHLNLAYRSDIPRWQGEDLRGKTLLLNAEQAYGDTIQFARFAPLVKNSGARVVLECQRELEPLLNGLPGVDHLIPQGRELPQCDCWSPLMSLPHYLRVSQHALADHVPYLHADPFRLAVWSQRLESDSHQLKIGIVRTGNPGHRNVRKRSCSQEEFLPLLQVPDVVWYDLQPDGRVFDVGTCATVRQIGVGFRDFADAAAVIKQLDLVVTVDSAVAHLAGAMGKPVWLLLPFVPDWRWMLNRTESPWYPSMRLFRQPSADAWDAVLDVVVRALRRVNRPSTYPSEKPALQTIGACG
jgi:Flp pilus assembly protein TadD